MAIDSTADRRSALGMYAFDAGSGSAPAAPTLPTSSATNDTIIKVAWAFVVDASKFDVYRSTTELSGYSIVGNDVAALFYNDTGLVAGTTYYYKIKAINDSGSSGFSVVTTTATLTDPSVERRAWAAFKTQIQANVTLSGYVTTWKFNRAEATLTQKDFPLVQCFVAGITEEEWAGIPKRKFTTLNVMVHGKVQNGTPDDLETEIIKLDEYLKNAIESFLQLSGDANIVDIGDSDFSLLADDVAQTVMAIQIKTVRFKAGER